MKGLVDDHAVPGQGGRGREPASRPAAEPQRRGLGAVCCPLSRWRMSRGSPCAATWRRISRSPAMKGSSSSWSGFCWTTPANTRGEGCRHPDPGAGRGQGPAYGQYTGAPIPPEHLPRLFERFYRADPSRSRDQGGYGLGLAIAHSITGRHRGRITVDSQEKTGTTFTVWLPLK